MEEDEEEVLAYGSVPLGSRSECAPQQQASLQPNLVHKREQIIANCSQFVENHSNSQVSM